MTVKFFRFNNPSLTIIQPLCMEMARIVTGPISRNVICLLTLILPIFATKITRNFKSATPPGENPSCGYESCPKLNPKAEYHVHLVPHRLISLLPLT